MTRIYADTENADNADSYKSDGAPARGSIVASFGDIFLLLYDIGMFDFKISSTKGLARCGIVTTPHGLFETPAFMAVGTVGAVKSVAPWELKQLSTPIILGNTYHLMLRPGEKLIKSHGGLHGFMKWDGPVLTDSGGFQVFSLGERMAESKRSNKDIKPAIITDNGVTFYSHLDGRKHFIDAFRSVKIQQDLGADIIMAFDECPPGDAPKAYVEKAVERTHRWLEDSIRAWTNRRGQALFGIVQGATYKSLRQASAKFINDCDLPGNAIGGVAVGESREKIWRAVEWSVPHLTAKKPRYLMGVGEPADIIEAVKRGCDMFDCVLPTRLARHGVVWVNTDNGVTTVKKATLPGGKIFAYGNMNLMLSRYREDENPIDKACGCPTCKAGFSRSYIRHLMSENEVLGLRLTTLHNLHFIYRLMDAIRKSI